MEKEFAPAIWVVVFYFKIPPVELKFLFSSMKVETQINMSICSEVFQLLGRPVNWFGHPNSGSQKTLFKFSFFSCI